MSGRSNPLFSIITPTCSRPELLRRNILSVINQTYADYEHIIIDDACHSNTSAIVNSFSDKRIVYLKHDRNKGASGCYNSGIRNSRGKFITFLDDDDEYLPQYLDSVKSFFSDDKRDIGFIWTGVSFIRDEEGGSRIIKTISRTNSFRNAEDALIAATSIGNGYGLCMRRECTDEIGLYDESLKLAVDTDYLFRLAQKFRFEVIPDILVKIHLHSLPQMTDSAFNQDRIRYYEEILERNRNLLKKYPNLLSVHLESVAGLCYKSKNKAKGRRVYFSIIRNTPLKIKTYPDFLSYELTGQNFTSTFIGKSIKRFLNLLNEREKKHPGISYSG